MGTLLCQASSLVRMTELRIGFRRALSDLDEGILESA